MGVMDETHFIYAVVLLPFYLFGVCTMRFRILLQEYYLVGRIEDDNLVKHKVNLPYIFEIKLLNHEVLGVAIVKRQDLALPIQADYHVIDLIKKGVLWKVQLFAFALDLDAHGVMNQFALLEIINKEPVPQCTVMKKTPENFPLCQETASNQRLSTTIDQLGAFVDP